MVEQRLLRDCGTNLLASFDCENSAINEYFRTKAAKDDDATTYCFITTEGGKETVVALSSLSCSAILLDVGYKDIVKIHVHPAVEIKMFAVDKAYQHKAMDESGIHWSEYCLTRTLGIIYHVTDHYCGASRVVLYSVPKAVNFYRHNGFEVFTDMMRGCDKPFLEGCIPMFMHL